ncbi:UNVERIFIED_CONTAM: hypothetical protein FKN15_016219 [Acipenser sinensis]
MRSIVYNVRSYVRIRSILYNVRSGVSMRSIPYNVRSGVSMRSILYNVQSGVSMRSIPYNVRSVKKRPGSHKQEAVGSGFKEPHRPVQTGSLQFIKELRSRAFPSADEVVLKPSGSQLTVEYLEENTFSVPILVTKKEGLGMRLPPSSFSVNDVEDHIGADKEIDVIDVRRQADCKMKLGDFVRYYNSPERDKVLNVISLEFSETRLSNLIETPKIVRKLSWVENLWLDESQFERPNVQKYCLMSMKDSYTDFHIDFGGTSVWYHVLRGEGKKERKKEGKKERKKEGKKERKKEGKKERKKEGKKERKKEGKKERKKEGKKERKKEGKKERKKEGKKERKKERKKEITDQCYLPDM